MWKKENDKWVRTCHICKGSGKEVLSYYKMHSQCCFQDDGMEKIEHPSNGKDSNGVGHHLTRCNLCGSVWLYFTEPTNNSMDVPYPIHLGYDMPGNDWRWETALVKEDR